MPQLTNETKAILVEWEIKLEQMTAEIQGYAEAVQSALPGASTMLDLAADYLKRANEIFYHHTPRRAKGFSYPLDQERQEW